MYVRTKVNRCQRSRYSGGYSASAIAVAIAGVRTYESEQRSRYSGGYSGSAVVVATKAILNMSLLLVKQPSRLSFKNAQILNYILSTYHTTSSPKTNSIIFSLNC